MTPTSDARGAAATELEQLRARLEESGLYRVLRRLPSRSHFNDPSTYSPSERLYSALFVDTETTGLDPQTDKVIELAMIAFDYDRSGAVYGIRVAFSELEDPGFPIPPEVTLITGITDEDVKGKRFDDRLVAEAVASADLVIAHNAAFDRPFLEERFPVFVRKPWACSIRDVNWRELGFASSNLEFLAFRRGFFYDAHRALVDCRAGIELLAEPLHDDEPPMSQLRASALKKTVRLWAEGAAFAKKDALKERGYRFNGQSKVWWCDVPAEEHDAELEWLSANVYGRPTALPYREVTAMERYSSRVTEFLPAEALRR